MKKSADRRKGDRPVERDASDRATRKTAAPVSRKAAPGRSPARPGAPGTAPGGRKLTASQRALAPVKRARKTAAPARSAAFTSADRSALRARAHGLDPVVMIGSDGLTPAVLKEIDANLTAHELIKVRVFGDDRDAREAMLDQICDALGARPIQHIGKLLVLWRAKPEAAPAARADGRKPGPKTVLLVTPSRTGRRPPTRKKATVLGTQRVTAGGKIKKAKPRQRSIKKSVAD